VPELYHPAAAPPALGAHSSRDQRPCPVWLPREPTTGVVSVAVIGQASHLAGLMWFTVIGQLVPRRDSVPIRYAALEGQGAPRP
jgi:hypothetical protein